MGLNCVVKDFARIFFFTIKEHFTAVSIVYILYRASRSEPNW